MKIDACRFVSGDEDKRCEILQLDPESLQEEKNRGDTLPLAYVVCHHDLARFLDLPQVFKDRHAKHARKELASYLLGNERIPVIRGSYTDAGQLNRSIQRLLKRAAGQDNNIYVIGAAEEVFFALRQRAKKMAKAQGSPDPFAAARKVIASRILGNTAKMRELRENILEASTRSDMPATLIVGETGTGKTRIAETIHEASARQGRLFVKLDCPTLDPHVYQSEMHGVRANYPGFQNREELVGKLEQADGGTLFMDEMGDLRRDVQPMLLADVEEKVVKPMGKKPRKVDFRVISATDQDLQAMKERGQFREQLYYRIAHFIIRCPRLSEVKEDIGLLADHFWTLALNGMAQTERSRCFPRPPPGLLRELQRYSWPGNVRDLKRVIDDLAHIPAARKPAALVKRFRCMLEGWAEESGKSWGTGMGGLPILQRVREALDSIEDAVSPILAGEGGDETTRLRIMTMLEGRLRILENLRATRSVAGRKQTQVLMRSLSGHVEEFNARLASSLGDAKDLWQEDIERVFAETQGHLESRIDEAARMVHAVYVAVKRRVTGELDSRPYEQLPADLRNSNREQFLNMPKIFKAFGYWIRPAKRTEILIPPLAKTEVEEMARREHERWLEERTRAGWVWDQIKDEQQKHSPYLVPWEKIPENIKEYSRDAVRWYPEILKEMGIEVYKTAAIGGHPPVDGPPP